MFKAQNETYTHDKLSHVASVVLSSFYYTVVLNVRSKFSNERRIETLLFLSSHILIGNRDYVIWVLKKYYYYKIRSEKKRVYYYVEQIGDNIFLGEYDLCYSCDVVINMQNFRFADLILSHCRGFMFYCNLSFRVLDVYVCSLFAVLKEIILLLLCFSCSTFFIRTYTRR